MAWQWLPARNHPPPRYILYKTRWSSLTHRYWPDPFARATSSLSLKAHGPSERELWIKRQIKRFMSGHKNGGGGHSSTATSDARLRCFCSTSLSSTLAPVQSAECSASCRKTLRRRRRAGEQQLSGLVPRYLLPPSSRYVHVW